MTLKDSFNLFAFFMDYTGFAVFPFSFLFGIFVGRWTKPQTNITKQIVESVEKKCEINHSITNQMSDFNEDQKLYYDGLRKNKE